MRDRKIVDGWAIRHWNYGLYVDTVRRTRNEAIAAFMEIYGVGNRRWDHDRRYRVHKPVRVVIAQHVAIKAVK